MSEGKIAVRYAKALFEAAADKGILDRVREDFSGLLAIDKEVPEFRDLLESPVMNVEKKKEAFSAMFRDALDQLSLKFLLMTVENKREIYIPSISRVFMEFYKEKKGIKEARISSAGLISGEVAERFKKTLEDFYKCKIELETIVRPELIGGFILRVEDQQLDNSVATQLRKIKKELDQSVLS